MSAVIHLLDKPYVPKRILGMMFTWGGIIIFKRTLLVIFETFIQPHFLAKFLICLLSFFSLFGNAIAWPFVERKMNVAYFASECALLLIAITNFSHALVDSMQITPAGHILLALNDLSLAEQILVEVLPLVAIGFIILYNF